MRNIKLQKTINLTFIPLVLMLLVVPFVGLAQNIRPVPPGPVPDVNTASDLVLRIIQIFLAVAGLVAVVFLIIGGFRYITAGGNEETAEAAKKTIVNAIIGIVIIILAFVIVRVISNALIGGASQV